MKQQGEKIQQTKDEMMQKKLANDARIESLGKNEQEGGQYYLSDHDKLL